MIRKFKIENLKLKVNPWMVISLLLVALLITSFTVESQGVKLGRLRSIKGAVVNPVLAAEIYPLFFCPCCGQPLDKNKICCGAAKERIDYIDSLAVQNLSEKEIILAYVKKYGLNSFVDKNKGEEIKEELIKTAPANRPIISLSSETYDFGDVSQGAGKVFTYFNLKNEGKSDLVIDRLDTSCGCTFASLIFRGSESPFFTMPGHGSENPEWEGVAIPPGETAQLKIMYDPDVHKDFRGTAIREIYVFSNDPIDFETKVKVELSQID